MKMSFRRKLQILRSKVEDLDKPPSLSDLLRVISELPKIETRRVFVEVQRSVRLEPRKNRRHKNLSQTLQGWKYKICKGKVIKCLQSSSHVLEFQEFPNFLRIHQSLDKSITVKPHFYARLRGGQEIYIEIDLNNIASRRAENIHANCFWVNGIIYLLIKNNQV